MGIIMTVGSLIVGGLITFFCSKHYYKKAGKELEKEATELRRLIKLMLLGMEHAGWVELNKDAQGNILSFRFTLDAQGGTLTMTSSTAALVQTKKAEAEGNEPD